MGKHNSKLNPNDITELAQQTAYTEDELRKWYKEFLVDFPNGALRMDDIKKIYGRQFPLGDATAFAEYIFRRFDVNGDGWIDFKEIITALSVCRKGSLDEKLTRAFCMYDLDNNGFISRDEMQKIVKAIYKMVGVVDESMSEKRVDDIFKKIDKNIDGKISMTEFIEGTKNDPAMMKLLQCDAENSIMNR